MTQFSVELKKIKGMELTTEEKLLDIQTQISRLIKHIEILSNKINELEGKNETPTQQMYNPKDLLIGTISSLYFVKEYEYKNVNWVQFLVIVNLNGNEEKFYRDTPVGTDTLISVGDIISFKVHGTKIKEVNVLREV
jgi:hypothetical protein